MEKDSNTDYKQIARYLAGECSAGEVKEMEIRMKNDPDYAELVRDFQKVWNTKKKHPRTWDIEGVWQRMSKEMDVEEPQEAFMTKTPVTRKRRVHPLQAGRRSRIHWLVRIAAVFIVIGFASLFAVLWLGSDQKNDFPAMQEVVTEPGQRATIHLDDGSRVRLNSASRLRHPGEFDPLARTVHLTGEAYFEIARDGRPFYVYAEEAVIEILGTEFNVQAYEGEEKIQVVVAEGKVSVHSTKAPDDKVAFLEPGDLVSLDRAGSGTISVVQNADLFLHLGWLEYRLAFDDTPMTEVARQLERWYGVNIHFSDAGFEELNLSATFEDESIREVLRVIEIALNLDYSMEGRRITFFRDE